MDVKSENASRSCTSTVTISELIFSLKSAFQNVCFSEVEAALISREETLKQEIESLKKGNQLLVEKLGAERLEKSMIKEECLKLKDTISGLHEEKLEIIADHGKTVDALMTEKCELACAKLTAETQVESYKRRFSELETRVSVLDKQLKILGSGDDDDRAGPAAAAAADVKIEQEEVSLDDEKQEQVADVELADKDATLIAGSGSKKDIVEIMDSDDDSPPSKVSRGREIDSLACQENALPEKTVAKNETGVLKRKLNSSINIGGHVNEKNDNDRDVDDTTPIKAQKLSPVSKNSPVKCGSAANMSSETKSVARDFPPSSSVLPKLEEKLGINDRISCSSSSSSDSDDDMDFSVPLPFIFANYGRKERVGELMHG